MQLFATFGAFLAGLAATGHALATPKDIPSHASVPIIHNKDFVRNPIAELARAYNKHKTPLPADIQGSVHHQHTQAGKGKTKRKGTTHTFVETNPRPETYDREYTALVTVGTPGESFELIFDTGSSDLWLFTTQTPSNQLYGQKIWDPKHSSTSKLQKGESWGIYYGDGTEVSGDVYKDNVAIGGLTVKDLRIGSAKSFTYPPTDFPTPASSSGIIGLAFDSYNTFNPKAKTWFGAIQPQLESGLFTANLKHLADGAFEFGRIDDSQYTGSINYTPVDSRGGTWQFTSSGYAIGSQKLNSHKITAIADTDTSFMLLPDDVVKAYWNQVQGSYYDGNNGGMIFPCNADLPDFTFAVGKGTLTVPGEYINYATATEDGYCTGGLQSSAGGVNIFGATAIKAGFVVFDAQNSRLGWATKDLPASNDMPAGDGLFDDLFPGNDLSSGNEGGAICVGDLCIL